MIIEDLDRIDPEHIFRILNVISAHYDQRYHDEYYHNKFGFDKIIIVSDYQNIKNIFHHRYGVDVDFDGYINKFYSTSPFHFNNNNAILEIQGSIEEIVYHRDGSYWDVDYASVIKKILSDLVRTQNISLREIIALKSQDFAKIKNESAGDSYSDFSMHKGGFYYPIIEYFSFLGNAKALRDKIEKCKRDVGRDKFVYHKYTLYGFSALNLESYHNESFRINLNGKTYQISYPNSDRLNFKVAKAVQINNSTGSLMNNVVDFNAQDFYSMIILSIEMYIKINNAA